MALHRWHFLPNPETDTAPGPDLIELQDQVMRDVGRRVISPKWFTPDLYYLRRDCQPTDILWFSLMTENTRFEDDRLVQKVSKVFGKICKANGLAGVRYDHESALPSIHSLYWRWGSEEKEFWELLTWLTDVALAILNSEDCDERRTQIFLARYHAIVEGPAGYKTLIEDQLRGTNDFTVYRFTQFWKRIQREVNGQQWIHFLYNLLFLVDPAPRYMLGWWKKPKGG